MGVNSKPNSDKDLINSLPDEIITHILSFVSTKSAVATSVLSKRWNQLWTSVPNLDFGDDHWLNVRFEKFVDRVLTLNKVPCARKIRLHHYENLDVNRVDAWISSIVWRDAELANWSCKVPQLVNFPNLKTIHLRSVSFDDEDSMKNLLFGCPVLKKLFIVSSVCSDALTFYICSSTLHGLRLHMSNCYTGKLYCYNLVNDTPNLRDLDIVVDGIGVSHTITNASSLVKLRLHLDRNDQMSLELSTSMPVFHNLIHLTLDITTKNQWECLARLLYLTPNLVTFVLLSSYCLSCDWHEPSEVPHCMSSCLESVEFTICLSEGGQEGTMISYFLKNANVLKELHIYTCPAFLPEKKNEAVKTLPTLPRSSIACQVYFDGVGLFFLKGLSLTLS